MFQTNEIIFFQKMPVPVEPLKVKLEFQFFFNGAVCAPLPCKVTCIQFDDDLNKYVIINELLLSFNVDD